MSQANSERSEHMTNITMDWSHATIARRMDALINAGCAEVIPAFTKVLEGADGAQRKAWLYAVGVNALHHARRQQGQLDEETFVSVVALVGVSLSLVGLDANLASHAEELPRAEAKHVAVTGVVPNLNERVFVLARDPVEGLVRIRLTGWQIMADGSAKPIPNGTPPGPWVVADEPNARMTRPDGSTANLGLAESELMQECEHE
jgi:hypothetical protein